MANANGPACRVVSSLAMFLAGGEQMPDLSTDILGQVARLPLRPSEANALLPLFEAISNSLHAINDRFTDKDVPGKGRIDIDVVRDDIDAEKVVGFRVKDNGVGLDEANYRSFRTPFSRHKILRGGKGVGRLGWLKVFRKINVQSVYLNGQATFRGFDFVLRENDQIVPLDQDADSRTEVGTTVSLHDFYEEYGSRCPSRTETIVQRIIGHFLPVFAGEKSPQVIVHDTTTVDVRNTFASKIVASSEVLVDVSIGDTSQPILMRHMRCDKSIRPRGSQYNWMCFCANDRGVKEYGIDDQIGLRLLDEQEIYVGAVTGDYLDRNVNPQRTDFIFESEEGLSIRRQLAASVKEFLQPYVDVAMAAKRAVATSVISKNPQYLYLQPDLDGFVETLKPSSINEEAILGEMALHKYRRQRRFNVVKKEIEAAPAFDDAVADKVEEYNKFIQSDQKGTLAEYVVKRKSVLDLLDTLRGFEGPDEEKHHLESAVHQLLCPMQVDSHQLSIDDHNLWILDDRLAFYNFFASDRPIGQVSDVASGKEPDLALFYDSCFAWRESERVCDTIILVEFKRPGLEAYSDKNDPLMQLMEYVELFKSGKTVKDRKGAVISGIGSNTAFHCYIVADLTAGLQRRLRGKFDRTPDGRGLFGYTRNPDTYTEVIPYSKLLADAQARNAIFFEKLGLTAI